jgi:hypothetical protein
MLKKKTFGGIPPGAGVREDIVLLFQEMEDARNNLIQIQKLIGMTPEPNIVLGMYIFVSFIFTWIKLMAEIYKNLNMPSPLL